VNGSWPIFMVASIGWPSVKLKMESFRTIVGPLRRPTENYAAILYGRVLILPHSGVMRIARGRFLG